MGLTQIARTDASLTSRPPLAAANDTRTEQVFETKPMWVRYLKLRFLTHYGTQHYWSLSLLRAHGQTHVDKFNSDNLRLQEAKKVRWLLHWPSSRRGECMQRRALCRVLRAGRG